jgi:hypothetical protein
MAERRSGAVRSGGRGVAAAALLAIAAGGALAVAVGCGGADASSGVAKASLPTGVRSQNLEHESCDESGHKVDKVDSNNDGKPDIKRVYDGARELCRVSDLNHDGKPDMFEYFDAAGQVRRREADYDDNGVVNQIDYYEGGKLVRRELDAANQGKIDTWDTFDPATGKPLKRERDTTGDGRIDQWWSYEGDRVTIQIDKNGDGLPEPESTIVLGPGGVVIPTAFDGGAVAMPIGADAAAASPPPPPPPVDPASPTSPTSLDGPRPRLDVSDAGVAGQPKRGGAKR